LSSKPREFLLFCYPETFDPFLPAKGRELAISLPISFIPVEGWIEDMMSVVARDEGSVTIDPPAVVV